VRSTNEEKKIIDTRNGWKEIKMDRRNGWKEVKMEQKKWMERSQDGQKYGWKEIKMDRRNGWKEVKMEQKKWMERSQDGTEKMDGKKSRWTEEMDGKKSRWNRQNGWKEVKMDRNMDGKKSRWTGKMDGKKSIWSDQCCMCEYKFFSSPQVVGKLFYFILFFHLDTSYILSKMSPYYLKLPICRHIYNLRVCENTPSTYVLIAK
jgi:hypothetical protein